MPKTYQSLIKQYNENKTLISVKKHSYLSLILIFSIIILMILLIFVSISIFKYIDISSKYNTQKKNLVIKERERNAIYQAIFKDQRAIEKTYEENKQLASQVNYLKSQVSSLKIKQEEVYPINNYLIFKQGLKDLNTILSQNEYMFILTLFPFWKIDLQLKYKATIDGDTSIDMIRKCKDIKILLMVILLDTGAKIGGYSAEISFKNDNGYQMLIGKDNNSFLFNINKEEKYHISDISPNNEGLIIDTSNIRFNQDLIINNGYLKGVYAISDFPYGYSNSKKNEKGNSLTQGMKNFIITEIEVFEIHIYNKLTETIWKKAPY